MTWIASAMTARGPCRRGSRKPAARSCSSPTMPEAPTTGTTTSSRTRCCGSSSTRSGTQAPGRARARIPRRVARRVRRVNRAFADAVARGARRQPRRDGLLPRLPPLSRAALRARGATGRAARALRAHPLADGLAVLPEEHAPRRARGPARERRRRVPHRALGAELQPQLRGRGRAERTERRSTPSSALGRRAEFEQLRESDAVRADEATLPRPEKLDRAGRPNRSVEEHRARLPRLRAAARGASRSGAAA